MVLEVKVNCTFTWRSRWLLYRSLRGCAVSRIPCLAFSSHRLLTAEEREEYGRRRAEVADVWEGAGIDAEYGYAWRMDGRLNENNLPDIGFYCHSRDGVVFFIYDEDLVKQLEGRKIQINPDWTIGLQ